MNRFLREAAARVIDAYIEDLEENISAEVPFMGHPLHGVSDSELANTIDNLTKSANEIAALHAAQTKQGVNPASVPFKSARRRLRRVQSQIGAAKEIQAFRASGQEPEWHVRSSRIRR